MGDYSPGQMATMSSAIVAAQSALKAQNFSKVVSAINDYYSAQSYIPGTTTVQRGYAQAALNVVNNVGSGVVANNEVAASIGASNYTSEFRANLMFSLANNDFTTIQANRRASAPARLLPGARCCNDSGRVQNEAGVVRGAAIQRWLMRLLHAVPLGILWLSLPLSSAQAESALVPYSDFAIRTGMPPAPFRAAWAAPDASSSPRAGEPGHGPMSAAETATVQRRLGPVILDIPRGYLGPSDGYVRPYDYIVLWAALPDMSLPVDSDLSKSTGLGRNVLMRLSSGVYRIPDAEWQAKTLDQAILQTSIGQKYKIYSTKSSLSETIIISSGSRNVMVECDQKREFMPFPSCISSRHITNDIYLEYQYEREQLGGSITSADKVDMKIQSFIDGLIHRPPG